MIRIDEIYENTFWAWFKRNRPGTRMFMCEPFGRSDPGSVINYGISDPSELNYTFFFDQEPINLARHAPTFDLVKGNVLDLEYHKPDTTKGFLVTSEKDSATVDYVCRKYGWKSLYYFFHGWAALDWYRGYDHTFLMQPYEDRHITRTFIMPNRIIAGERQHRVIMLYHIFKAGMTNNHISCPAVCPAENVPIEEIVKGLTDRLPDIEEVFAQQRFPMNFAGETDSPMHSYQLSLFDEAAESLLYLVTETVATESRQHLTEKTFKPIALKMPFIIVGTCGSLAYLRSYGFRTFGHLWDESYDEEINDLQRYEKIAWTLRAIDELPRQCKQKLLAQAQEVCEYNYNHFYNGGFKDILWKELQGMLGEF